MMDNVVIRALSRVCDFVDPKCPLAGLFYPDRDDRRFHGSIVFCDAEDYKEMKKGTHERGLLRRLKRILNRARSCGL